MEARETRARHGRGRRGIARRGILLRFALLGALLAACALIAPSAIAAKAPARQAAARKAAARAKPAADPSAAAWKKARTLADEGRFREALDVTRRALGKDPNSTDLLWLEAGIMGWSGHHLEAVKLYEDLMTRHPEMAPAVRRDLANERLEAGDAAGAARDLDLRLQEDPSDLEARRLRATALARSDRLAEAIGEYDTLLVANPDDLDLALERAMVLGWAGRHDRAVTAYRGILATHPDNADARFGLAKNLNWRGDHRRAAALLEQLIREGDADPEAPKQLAFAYYWSGQPERARGTLDGYLVAHPTDREALELSAMLAREESPSLTTGYARSDDSEGLRVRTGTVDLRRPLVGRSTLVLGWRHDDVLDAGGTAVSDRLTGGLETRWSVRWEGAAYVTYYKQRSRKDGIGLGEVALVHRPSDRLRLDAGYAQDVVVTRQSLDLGIRIQTLALSADWQANQRIRAHADQRLNWYSDDNRSTRRSASVAGRVWSNERGWLDLGFAVNQLKTHLDLDHGYYDPERYIEFGPTAEAEVSGPRHRWTLAGQARLGWQREKFQQTDPFHDLGASLRVPLGEPLALAVEVGKSNSNLSSSSGFKQTRWGVYVTGGF